MCGIVGAIAQRDVLPILINGLKSLEYRGYDSAGIGLIQNSEFLIVKEKGKVNALEKKINKLKNTSSNIGIAHTRWATHGVPSPSNAHPHVCDNLCIVHNGIIENYKDLKKQLQDQGYSFSSQTDSEVLVAYIHYIHTLHPKNTLLQSIALALKDVQGTYAIALIDKNSPQNIYIAKMSSPLVIGVGLGENFIASDALALVAVTNSFIYLEDGQIGCVTKDNIEIFDQNLQAQKYQIHVSQLQNTSTSKGNFKHYMQKEIYEQPIALEDTINQFIVNNDLNLESIRGYKKGIFEDIGFVKIVACGTSYHAGLIARYYIEQLCKITTSIEIASEFRYRDSPVPNNALFIAISQSGETADTIAALNFAKKNGYKKTLALCNVDKSTLIRDSDMSFLTKAGVEIGVASTKAFTTQVISLLLIAIAIGVDKNILSKKQIASLCTHIKNVPTLVRDALYTDNEIAKLAPYFAHKAHTLFLGRSIMYPIALEGALKLKEISYIHAEGYASGELKHGPIALIDENMPVVVVAPDHDILGKLQSNIQEVKARGGELIVIASNKANISVTNNDKIIYIKGQCPFTDPIIFTIPLQLLAYHVALIKGTDVDQPRNLAKSVTVE